MKDESLWSEVVWKRAHVLCKYRYKPTDRSTVSRTYLCGYIGGGNTGGRCMEAKCPGIFVPKRRSPPARP